MSASTYDLSKDLTDAEEKLEKFLDKEEWTMHSNKKEYPITYTFRKGQMGFDTKNEQPPEITLAFTADIDINTSVPEDERISKPFLNKLINLTKEVHRLYLLYWFAQKDHRYACAYTPLYDVCGGKAQMAIVSKYYEP